MALGDVGAMIASQNASLSNSGAQMASDFSQVNDLSNAITAATVASGNDDVTIASQKAAGLLQAQQAAQSVASSYGGKPGDISFIMNQLGQQWMDTEAQRLQAEKAVQQKQSVNFLDDPLQWLSNKLTVNTDINNYNNLNTQSEDLYDQLSKINTLNSSTAESMKAIATTQTAATVAATADQAAQNAVIAANKAKLQGIVYNVEGIKDITNLTQEQVDNSIKGTQTAIAAGHLAVAQQQLNVMEQEETEKAAFYAQEVADKKAADADNVTNLGYINKGRAAMGLPPIADTSKAMNLIKLGGPAGEAIKSQLITGSLTDATGKTIISSTAGGAARILAMNQSPLATVNPAVKPVVTVLQSAYDTVRNPANAGQFQIKPGDTQTLDSTVSAIVNQKVTAMAADIRPNDASNIYQAPPLTALAQQAEVKSNPLYTKVLEPQIKAGMAETDPNKILQLTIDAIQQGHINLGEAASGLSGLFRSAALVNSVAKDYMRFGIVPQTSYNTTLDMTGVFGGQVKINMMDKAQVTAAIMKSLSAQTNLTSMQMLQGGM